VPGTGFARLERHLARLAASAAALGFPHDGPAARAALAAAVAGSSGALRVRLTLERDGGLAVTTAPFSRLAQDTVWRLAIAGTRLDADDALLAHKTTRRAAYDAARAEFGAGEADEVLLLNQAGAVCEGTITTLFAEHASGQLLTPALGCGLLAGVLRAEMLETGRAVEAVLTPDDLGQARRLYVGNSLRGLIAARLICD